MHDPDVVAFTIRRPWPRLSRIPRTAGRPRWRLQGAFWTTAGVEWYWPELVTIWHREPGGRDCGEVCKHYRRWRDDAGEMHTKWLRGWRWHVHHWRLQVHPLQALRRWALTRCAWCGGRHRRHDPVNISHGWDVDRGPWWGGERGLFHRDCSAVENAHQICCCDEPVREQGKWGNCGRCGLFYSFGDDRSTAQMAYWRALAAIPVGHRDRDRYEQALAGLKAAGGGDPAAQ